MAQCAALQAAALHSAASSTSQWSRDVVFRASELAPTRHYEPPSTALLPPLSTRVVAEAEKIIGADHIFAVDGRLYKLLNRC